MEGLERQNKSRVVKIASVDSWNSYFDQASIDGCPMEDFQKIDHLMLSFGGCVVAFCAFYCCVVHASVAMNPLVEELAAIYQDILFLTVDVDEIKGVAAKMSIKAMPTFVIMRYGAPVEKLVGANPEQIRKMINGFVQSVGA